VSLIVYILLLFVSGLLVGGLARLALPGRDPMSLFQTALVGMAGSLAAGLVYALIFKRNGGGLLLAIVFSTVIVYFIRRSRGGDLTRPGTPPARR
jgi:uncharacterized membrane protein YeaQ/YmgE (transglycosylase-associated protein family)